MHIAIAEDDAFCAQTLQGYLNRFAEEQNTAVRVSTFSSGRELLESYQPNWDLILMDIEMPYMDGMTAAKRIRERDSKVIIIFITRMAQFAINGYEVSAMDYVLKPISYPIFLSKMKRVQSLLQVRQAKPVIINHAGQTKLINPDQLYYVEVYNHTLVYHTQEGSFSATGSKTIRQLEEELASDSFFRCNYCYLVNLQYVQGIDQNTILLTNQKSLTISRNRRKEFMNAFMRYWGG